MPTLRPRYEKHNSGNSTPLACYEQTHRHRGLIHAGSRAEIPLPRDGSFASYRKIASLSAAQNRSARCIADAAFRAWRPWRAAGQSPRLLTLWGWGGAVAGGKGGGRG